MVSENTKPLRHHAGAPGGACRLRTRLLCLCGGSSLAAAMVSIGY